MHGKLGRLNACAVASAQAYGGGSSSWSTQEANSSRCSRSSNSSTQARTSVAAPGGTVPLNAMPRPDSKWVVGCIIGGGGHWRGDDVSRIRRGPGLRC